MDGNIEAKMLDWKIITTASPPRKPLILLQGSTSLMQNYINAGWYLIMEEKHRRQKRKHQIIQSPARFFFKKINPNIFIDANT